MSVVMNGKHVWFIEQMGTVAQFAQRGNVLSNPITIRHYSTGGFATFSATKILINEIMGRKVGLKLLLRIIFRA